MDLTGFCVLVRTCPPSPFSHYHFCLNASSALRRKVLDLVSKADHSPFTAYHRLGGEAFLVVGAAIYPVASGCTRTCARHHRIVYHTGPLPSGTIEAVGCEPTFVAEESPAYAHPSQMTQAWGNAA